MKVAAMLGGGLVLRIMAEEDLERFRAWQREREREREKPNRRARRRAAR